MAAPTGDLLYWDLTRTPSTLCTKSKLSVSLLKLKKVNLGGQYHKGILASIEFQQIGQGRIARETGRQKCDCPVCWVVWLLA